MHVPFVDLQAQYESIKPEIDSAIADVIAESAFIGGERVSAFEREFAEAQGADYCVAVANGTDALYVALRMLGVGPGDEVITVANSWISTSETISQAGARPVFVDSDDSFNIDINQIEDRITGRTRAVVPVHLYGQPANIFEIREICDRHDLILLEDCAQAHLAEIRQVKVGNVGHAGTFSFYPGKNLGAYGDAGAIITNDEDLATRCRMYARHGALVKHDHKIEGINSRLDGLQAAVLRVKLKYLDQWTRARQEVAARYIDLLRDVPGLVLPDALSDRTHVYHLFVIRTRKRDALQRHLASLDIQTSIHYPTALPFLEAYSYLGHSPSEFPVARRFQDEILSLPMFPELSAEQIAHVADSVRSFVSGS